MRRPALLAAVILALIFLWLGKVDPAGAYLSLAGQKINIEVADEPAERERGLSDRASLASDEGMLFIFPADAKPGFWMKDMKFPLDIVWLDADYRVVSINSHVTPASYPKTFYPPKVIRYVLEVNAGWANTYSLHPGDLAAPANLPR